MWYYSIIPKQGGVPMQDFATTAVTGALKQTHKLMQILDISSRRTIKDIIQLFISSG